MFRHTKIIATMGPSVADLESVRGMVQAGMDVARLNFSHGDHDLHRSFVEWVRTASADAGRPVAILQDIQGPKLRVGAFPDGGSQLAVGDSIRLVPEGGMGSNDVVPCGYDALRDDVAIGDRVVLSDGLIRLEVTERTDDGLLATVLIGGFLADNKGVAFPDSELSVPSVTPKDEIDLAFGRELGVDYVAASFVRSASDVKQVGAIAGDVPVVAKIELARAYENLDEILEESFSVMVARGDLGVQLPLERIPMIQSDILRRTNRRGRISITATEMLESMIHSPRPTRAEVTDVANAVMQGTDAVMLSGETAVGDFPVQTIEAMAEICRAVEDGTLGDRGVNPVDFVGDENTVASAVSQAATQVAQNLDVKAIVAFTESGSTARLISKYRPVSPILAFTPNDVTLRRMAIYWGVSPIEFERMTYTDEEIRSASEILQATQQVEIGDTVVMVAGVPPNVQASTNLVKVHVIGELSRGLRS